MTFPPVPAAMSPSAHDLDAFREQYRAFVLELIKLTDPRANAPTPLWADDLHDHPFAMPAMLAHDSLFDTSRRTMVVLAATWHDDVQAQAAARAIVVTLLLTRTQVGAEPPPSGSRGATRGPKRGKARDVEFVPPDDARDARPATSAAPPFDGGLLSVPEETRERTTRSARPPQSPPSEPQQHQNAEPPSDPESGAAPPVEVLPPEARYLNAGIKDHPRDKPLSVGDIYTLQFGVDLARGVDGVDFAARLPDAIMMFAVEESTVDVTIQLAGADFDIMPQSVVLRVPRRGPSSNRVGFAIIPKKAGRCTLTATVHKAGNYLLEMEISYSVGEIGAEPATSEVYGRALTAGSHLKPRELGLGFKPVLNGYECTIRGVGFSSVILPITEAELGDIVARARKAMMDVVTFTDAANKKVFQTMITIEDGARDAALRTLAFAGAEMFQRLFYGPLAGQDVNDVGDAIRARATKPGQVLNIQILAERFPIPWGMLYVGETGGGAALDWNNFLGIAHIIEQLPRQVNLLVDDAAITSNAPSLSVSVNVNETIDTQMKLDVVASQVTYWANRGAMSNGTVQVAKRSTKSELLAALQAQSNDQLMYLYCHAITASPADPGGIMSSCLVMSGDERVTLADLNREAPTKVQLPGHPLVFLNACESAELTPAFYDGFVPYFLKKGARGVVGTECKTPALFATAWAMQFFPRFLGGEALGPLCRDLRREFCFKHGNPLGLLYTVYCDGDTQVQPGLPS